ncbi:hypothetical protein PRIPAC_80834 [Pristionchus pacificus]|uniref:Uncharacterized protein n=1 Tax=Pristionchus pacificus TaxID=54126 RepID=A0A2A6CBT7_PRIPA|nr:hypothetical protein PRIPAC_80834 [Pristionchus pacificus]|eukprot:PDM75560.1 hypothetical protein PRIPAC_42737 [Pristionchus pacificus]
MLANLPPDIIRRIIPFEKYSFGYLQLISPTWNRMVIEHFNNREGRNHVFGLIQRQNLGSFNNFQAGKETIYLSSTLLYTRILEWKSHDIMPKFNRRFSPLMGNKISAVEEFKVSANATDVTLVVTRILEAANLVVIEKLQHLKGKFAVAFDIWNDFSWNAPNSFFFGMKYLPVDDMRAICQTLRGISANIFCVRMRICDVQKRDFMLDILKHVNSKRLMIRAGEFLLEVSKVLLMISIQQFGPEYRFFLEFPAIFGGKFLDK